MSEVTVNDYSIGDKKLYLQGVKRGEQNEQERLIKLLEEIADVYLADKLLIESAIILNAVAFIKGENK